MVLLDRGGGEEGREGKNGEERGHVRFINNAQNCKFALKGFMIDSGREDVFVVIITLSSFAF